QPGPDHLRPARPVGVGKGLEIGQGRHWAFLAALPAVELAGGGSRERASARRARASAALGLISVRGGGTPRSERSACAIWPVSWGCSACASRAIWSTWPGWTWVTLATITE